MGIGEGGGIRGGEGGRGGRRVSREGMRIEWGVGIGGRGRKGERERWISEEGMRG